MLNNLIYYHIAFKHYFNLNLDFKSYVNYNNNNTNTLELYSLYSKNTPNTLINTSLPSIPKTSLNT